MLLLLQMGSFKVLTTLLRFRTLGRSHSWSCPSCCVPASSGDSTPTNTATSSSDSSTAQSGPPFLLMQQSRPIFAFKSYPPSAYLVSSPSASLPPLLASGCFSPPPASSSPPPEPWLRVLQWNSGNLPASSSELLHFLSSHPVDPICIQEFNLVSSSVWIPGFSAL